jgi:O-antigen ligase
MIAERPLFGYGYGSALMGGFTPYVISRFKAQNAHNGYIDLALSTGMIGSLLLYAAIAVAIVRAVRSRNAGGANVLLATTLGTFVVGWLIASFSEVMLRPNMPMGSLGIASLVVLSCLGMDRGETIRG